MLNTGHKGAFTHYGLLANPKQMRLSWRNKLIRRGIFQLMIAEMESRPELIVGNSDQFAGWFCDSMHQHNSTWKFLFVVRDGIKSVDRFFRTLPWRDYQHFDRIWNLEWDTLSDFERSCYRWSIRNKIIYHRLMMLPKTRRCVVTLEGLTNDLELLYDIWQWLGIPSWADYENRNREYQGTRISKHRNGGLKDAAKIWESWNKEQKRIFENICGEVMVKFGFAFPK